MRALAESGQWDALRKFFSSSTLAYKSFAEICIEYGNTSEAISEYIKKIDDLGERAQMYSRAGAWTEALATVEKMKDPLDTLLKLKASCNSAPVLQSIQELYIRLSETSSKRSSFIN